MLCLAIKVSCFGGFVWGVIFGLAMKVFYFGGGICGLEFSVGPCGHVRLRVGSALFGDQGLLFLVMPLGVNIFFGHQMFFCWRLQLRGRIVFLVTCV